MKLSVLGAGAWGTALAASWAPHHIVTLWGRNAAELDAMRTTRVNARYLADCRLPDALHFNPDLGSAVEAADLIVLAVPSGGLRPTLAALATRTSLPPLIWVSKGFEPGSRKLPHQLVAELLPTHAQTGVLSGPSFAQEVAQGYPTALTLACHDTALAQHLAESLSGQRLRIYAHDDVIGVELGGALKNVMAIAAGICDGLQLGHNARAALITRGLAEMTRLGVKLGGHFETFMGLSGLGDLILTTTGDLSRNRQVGLRLARGLPLDAILRELGHVAEGVTTAREVAALADELGVDMPVAHTVYQVLFDGMPAAHAVDTLLNREIKTEF
ncbi:MAG: NAD(P)-dependent glycerol-3-phosphate dehydrogenase [Thiobacillus sp.]|uniref:NAD(P)H-dependent glycerol-3-phosphate dehydrogenase n=1 Tax=Thiobacillus sp. 0-1251 TaxID=1895858 RepID=UPI00096364DF|nr:NAD(P)H-dependent glycerol-3-phosphate dehydrogenase [Thiobacillus sp. 0-1251]MBN8770333.1 NAD(P)-dependent glycerol-3-phosphate dehydrogenase [Thiobacillus sp.]MBS0329110.1 NAD(P)-dependent glycerol-3-phosphate dehydrogenase [Pseudomonadota bacterium]OJY59819.1 MAG: glycerol-3-phosphate dehydrogenase [Thiobacillus sp. 0-1251]